MEIKKCDRKFRWMSSVSGEPDILSSLNEQMAWFYGQQNGREMYQSMLNTQEEIPTDLNSVRHLMPKYICDLKPQTILEIGCANGRLYRQLRQYGYQGDYSGIEMADYIIQQNSYKHPEAHWQCSTAYSLPFPDSSFDICFSLYVLEHLVYPERALNEMMRVIKANGYLILVFPDFIESGRFASQNLGFSPIATASQKLRKGKVIDALVSLYDSRIRLPKALKRTEMSIGDFPINTRPLCLSYPSLMQTDIDAIYIASKKEVHYWATSQGFQVKYPCGTEDEFAEQAFIAISKVKL
ncbi:class I SAM-dependent methyltransferase [Nostoc sp. UHCC 0251]|uniref:class I SAM-dependent methyltransferase n=1 Tax=Nostoc sp. UHCC 0251 TaxID=3110240 RepID=UPI002B20F6A8|nr:class I SAM-dependent methyltransferase [Nostoc sp. UHCC 0251]MEA5626098.1 class I SAM-dependent methyltransferase [Nostoc sp. UHCC 0251]